jgi:hypothetical protein
MPIQVHSDEINATGNVQRDSVDLKSGILTGVHVSAVTNVGTVTLKSGGAGGKNILPQIHVGIAASVHITGLAVKYVAPLHATIDDTNTTMVVHVDEGA